MEGFAPPSDYLLGVWKLSDKAHDNPNLVTPNFKRQRKKTSKIHLKTFLRLHSQITGQTQRIKFAELKEKLFYIWVLDAKVFLIRAATQ